MNLEVRSKKWELARRELEPGTSHILSYSIYHLKKTNNQEVRPRKWEVITCHSYHCQTIHFCHQSNNSSFFQQLSCRSERIYWFIILIEWNLLVIKSKKNMGSKGVSYKIKENLGNKDVRYKTKANLGNKDFSYKIRENLGIKMSVTKPKKIQAIKLSVTKSKETLGIKMTVTKSSKTLG